MINDYHKISFTPLIIVLSLCILFFLVVFQLMGNQDVKEIKIDSNRVELPFVVNKTVIVDKDGFCIKSQNLNYCGTLNEFNKHIPHYKLNLSSPYKIVFYYWGSDSCALVINNDESFPTISLLKIE